MPIPNLSEQGLLPPGIYDCSLEEIGERFGTFQSTDRRPRLYEKLQAFLQQVRSINLARVRGQPHLQKGMVRIRL